MPASFHDLQFRKWHLPGKKLSASDRYDLIAGAMENPARHLYLTQPFPHIEGGKAFQPCRQFRRRKLLRLLQVTRAGRGVTIGHGALMGKLIEHRAGISRHPRSHGCQRAGIDATMVLAGTHARRA